MSQEKRWVPLIAAVLVLALIGLCVAAVLLGQQVLRQRAVINAATPTTRVEVQPPPTETFLTPTVVELPTAAEPAPVPSGRQVLRQPGGDPPTLDPHLSGDSTSAEYIVEIFSGLLTLDRELNLVPDLAESWTVNDTDTVYTFTLRSNAQFHDGKPVRASDFKWSFERACDPATGSYTADTYLGDIVGCRDKLRGKADSVAGVEALDDRTLRITIDAPRVYFLSKLTFPASYVLDRSNVESGGAAWATRPNGTGPFKLAQMEPGVRIVL